LVSPESSHSSDYVLQHSERVIRSLSAVALVGHGIILIVVLILGILPLVYFNIVSCFVLALARRMSVRGRIVIAFYIGLIEVSAHAWFCDGCSRIQFGFSYLRLGFGALGHDL
jgi:hypothetical protein